MVRKNRNRLLWQKHKPPKVKRIRKTKSFQPQPESQSQSDGQSQPGHQQQAHCQPQSKCQQQCESQYESEYEPQLECQPQFEHQPQSECQKQFECQPKSKKQSHSQFSVFASPNIQSVSQQKKDIQQDRKLCQQHHLSQQLQSNSQAAENQPLRIETVQKLMLSPVIIGRQTERQKILQYINQSHHQSTHILNIIGSPGTGKTSSVAQVIASNNLQLTTVMINGLTIRDIKNNKNSVLQTIKEHELQLVAHMKLLVIDEFDCISQKEPLLMNIILHYPQCQVILISNNIQYNLSKQIERETLYFFPYTMKELCNITENKLQSLKNYIDQDMIKIAVCTSLKKSNDFRELTKLLVLSFSNALAQGSKIVDFPDIVRNHEKNPIQTYILSCGRAQILIWMRLRELTEKEGYKSKNQYCQCQSKGLQITQISRQHKKYGLTDIQVKLCFKQWQQMDLIRLKKTNCYFHKRKFNQIEIKHKQIIYEALSQYLYKGSSVIDSVSD